MYVDCSNAYYLTFIFGLGCIFVTYIDFDIIIHVYYACLYHVEVDVIQSIKCIMCVNHAEVDVIWYIKGVMYMLMISINNDFFIFKLN